MNKVNPSNCILVSDIFSIIPSSLSWKPHEQIKRRLSKEMEKSGLPATLEAVYNFLIQRVRENLHVVLCMSPIGDAFRNRLRQYPALINCTTIDWFLEWPKEALLEVGNKFLVNLDLTVTITGGTRKVRNFFALENERNYWQRKNKLDLSS